jgi:serine/threonine-protein kinase
VSELAVDFLLEGKYRIVRFVGAGAWASVYEAVNVRIGRRVAIKVLNVELASHPELHARFNREAEAATQIESPFVVTVLDAGTLEDGCPYIVMEFLEGEDLGRRLRRLGTLPEEQAACYAIHLLSGLADAHATGILHRDIKPDNLVVVRSKNGQEILKIVDFGISKPSHTRPEMMAMTRVDQVLGSPVYMAPEQARGTRHMDHRSDLYAVGIVLFEALTGHLPHEAENFNELMFKIALEDAPDPRTKKADLDPAMADIIAKSLSRDPDKRFQSAVEYRQAISDWIDSRGGVQPHTPYDASKKLQGLLADRDDRGSAPRISVPGALKQTPPNARATSRLSKTSGRPNPTLASTTPEGGAARTSGASYVVGAETLDETPFAPAPTPEAEGGSDPKTSFGATTTASTTRRPMLPLVLGGAAFLLIGAGVGIALMRPTATPPPPVVATVTSTSSITPVPEPSALAPPPVASTTASTTIVAATANVSSAAPTPSAPSTVATTHPTWTARAPAKPAPAPVVASASASAPRPAPTPTSSNAIVDGRSVRTTF